MAATVLAGLAYWQYLFHLTHQRIPAAHRAAAVSAVAVAKPVSAAEPAAQLPPVLKKTTATGITAIWTYLLEFVKISTVVPPPAVPASPPASRPQEVMVPTVAAPVAQAESKPTSYRKPRVLTPELRLQRAAQTALNNMLDQANKYPDAYGFGPGDAFVETKLGNPIPVYTIAETDRANYQAGQPVKPLLKPANQWVFPVLAGGRTCCMVRVNYTGHEYVPGSGSKSLAMAWSKILDQWPAEEGFHPQLVVNPAIPGYFFTIPELPMPNVTDVDQMFLYHPSLSPADVILASWR